MARMAKKQKYIFSQNGKETKRQNSNCYNQNENEAITTDLLK